MKILGAYLCATAPMVVLGAAHAGSSIVALAHIALLAAVLAVIRRGGRQRWLGWIPLALIPFMYLELRLLVGSGGELAGLGDGLHDQLVQQWESAVFGVSPTVRMAGRFPVFWLSELLHAAYLSYYAIIYVPPMLAFFHRREDVFDQLIAALMTTFCLCFFFFAMFPVAGPRYLWPAPPSIPDGPMRHLAVSILSAGSSRGTAFPSSHAAVAVTQSIALWRWDRRLSVGVGTLTGLLCGGAVYGGFHYGIDVVAGVGVGVIVGVAALRFRPRET